MIPRHLLVANSMHPDCVAASSSGSGPRIPGTTSGVAARLGICLQTSAVHSSSPFHWTPRCISTEYWFCGARSFSFGTDQIRIRAPFIRRRGRRNRRGIQPDPSHIESGVKLMLKFSRFSSKSLKMRGFLDHGFAIKSIPIYVR